MVSHNVDYNDFALVRQMSDQDDSCSTIGREWSAKIFIILFYLKG